MLAFIFIHFCFVCRYLPSVGIWRPYDMTVVFLTLQFDAATVVALLSLSASATARLFPGVTRYGLHGNGIFRSLVHYLAHRSQCQTELIKVDVA